MAKRNLAISSFLILATAIVLFTLDNSSEPGTIVAFSEDAQIIDAELSPHETSNSSGPRRRSRNAVPISIEVTESISSHRQIELVLKEIDNRLDDDQTEEALNELNGLLENYEYLSDAEKIDLLTAYATFFLKNSQNDNARFFYEQILSFPNLEHTNRLAVLQMLARIAMASEDWNGFLAYNDQYFDEGGGYNWVVTGHLLSAYQRLGDIDAAGEALLLHLETGINPQYDGSDEQYQRLYGNVQDLPLRMSDTATALQIAQGMVDQFDRAENWKVLSEVYETLDDQSNFNQVVETARDKGYLDIRGNWQLPTPSQ